MKSAITFASGLSMGTVLALALTTSVALALKGAACQVKPVVSAKKGDSATPTPIYDKSADAKVQVARATERAKRENKRVLLMFGGDWCGWCHKLHGLFASNPEVRKVLGYEYVLVMIDTEATHAADLLNSCKAALSKDELQKSVGFPFLAVLDADGKVVKAQRTGPLEDGDHHDPKRVEEFLSRHKVPQENAKVVLAEAQSHAASYQKRVFLIFGAPWCGWCHELENWIERPEIAAILDRDFVPVKVDIERMTAGKDLMASFRSLQSQSRGIPWYTILDSDGKSLATADGPNGLIGYPGTPQEIDDFMAMIKGQARHIDARQLDQLRRSLNEAAERLKKHSGR